jgi:uncharacterized protein (DUF302 family)
MNSLFVINTPKSFEAACTDLRTAVVSHDFGVMAVHDLGKTLRSKGIDFSENCCVFDVCNPEQAAKVLECDMALNVALPCRISVYTDAGQTWIAMIRPSAILNALSSASYVFDVAQEVDSSTSAMINEAALQTEPASP